MATADSGVKHEIEGLPVDQTTTTVIRDGKTCTLPAISPEHVARNSCYWLYKPPSSIFSSSDDRLAIIAGDATIATKYESEIAVYCQSMQYLLMDLNSILHADYSRFWSHVTYDDAFLLVINNYIRMAPRWFDPQTLVATGTLESMHEELHEVIFKLIMRMSTSRESKSDHMSLETFKQYLETHVYDAPKILDICTLYGFTQEGPANSILKKMLKSVLTKQPRLVGKLGDAARSFLATINGLKDVCVPTPDVEVATIAMCVAAITLKTLDDEFLLETCTTATEVAASLLLLVKNTPYEVLQKFSKVIDAMPDFYESVFLALTEEIERRQDSIDASFKVTLENLLLTGMACTLEVYRHYVNMECMSKVTDFLTNADAVTVVERYYAIFMQAISEKMFLLAYNSLYPLENDFDGLRKHPATREYVDESHLSFILNSLQAPVADTTVREENIYGKTVEYAEGAVGGVSDNVTSILAVFPDLRTEFVEECLQFYNGNVDEVVTAIMDNNLHPELEKKRNSPSKSPPETADSAAVDAGAVHIGKKNKVTKDLLDDRAEKFNLRKIVLQYSDVVDEVVVQQGDKLYDDEYDDTYDSHDIGIPEKSTEDRVYETPRILAGPNERRKKHWEQEQPEEEMDEEGVRKKRQEFCENPEIVRARREQRYQDRMANRGRQPPSQRDVVGNVRGQGQSDDVLRNRNLKERHKGGNRKNQADRKRREF